MEAPDRETDDEEDREDEEECCDLCFGYGAAGFVYPCDCSHGIKVAHAYCFEEWRNSWPLAHPNRVACKYCGLEYDVPSPQYTVDRSKARRDVYTMALYTTVHSACCNLICLLSLPTTINLLFVASLYTSGIYMFFDLLALSILINLLVGN